MNTNEILKGSFFVELEILSSRTTSKEMREYERSLKEYHKEVERAESLALNSDIEEPQEPGFNVSYRKTKINFGDIIILGYDNDWDEEHDTEIIIADVVYKSTGGFAQYNIKMSMVDWELLLIRFGARYEFA